MAECWTAGVKAGIDAATIVKVFNEAALGQMMSLKVCLPAAYLRGDFEPRFSLASARKDLGRRSWHAPPTHQCRSVRFANRK